MTEEAPKKKRGRPRKTDYGPSIRVSGKYADGKPFEFRCHQYRKDGSVYVLTAFDGGAQTTTELRAPQTISITEPIGAAPLPAPSPYSLPPPAPTEGPKWMTPLAPTSPQGQLMTKESMIAQAVRGGQGVAAGMLDEDAIR